MKRSIFLAFLSVLLLSLCACGAKPLVNRDAPPASSAVSPSSTVLPEYTTEEYDADGKLIRRNHHVGSDDNISSYVIFEYNGDKLIRKTQYRSTGSVSNYREYEYDASGLLLRSTYHDIWTGTSGTSEYDASGNTIRTVSYKKDGSIRYSSEYEYDSRGNITRETLYHPDSSLMDWNTREYNSAGQCIRITRYSPDGTPVVTEYTPAP